jgi:hypothetical protein
VVASAAKDKDPYNSKPLPFVIGTRAFLDDMFAGLPIPKDAEETTVKGVMSDSEDSDDESEGSGGGSGSESGDESEGEGKKAGGGAVPAAPPMDGGAIPAAPGAPSEGSKKAKKGSDSESESDDDEAEKVCCLFAIVLSLPACVLIGLLLCRLLLPVPVVLPLAPRLLVARLLPTRARSPTS